MTGVLQLRWGPILAASGEAGAQRMLCSGTWHGTSRRRTAAPEHPASAGTARPDHVLRLTALQSTGDPRRGWPAAAERHRGYRVTLVVFTLLPLLQLQPERSGSTLHSSPSRHGSIWHHHFCSTMEASTQEGAARVVPATCPGKQEHFTVWERSSILFLLQHR